MDLSKEFLKQIQNESLESLESILDPSTYQKVWEDRVLSSIKGTYILNEDGTYTVNGDVDFSYQDIEYFPISFHTVTGKFDCSYCLKLKTLKGAPIYADYFDCSYCSSLVGLEGCPKEVNHFKCIRWEGRYPWYYIESVCKVKETTWS